jgi:hypothetical protein
MRLLFLKEMYSKYGTDYRSSLKTLVKNTPAK